ncbi:MAG: outer membrane lipoprotein-sorting protein [Terracidiphilus sp.]
MSSHRVRGVSGCVVPMFVAAALWPAHANTSAAASMPLTQILALMEHHDQIQREGLKRYRAIRQYHVEYRGLGDLEAGMKVEIDFNATSGKSFRIVSESGSKILGEKVLKRAMDSEKEASENRDATALTPANYRFQLQGSESLDGRPAYILSVEPRRASKFLYRGKIWVDATDFAIAKIEAAPAKNPSFWISRTLIRYTSAKVGDFWLPQRSRSESKIRIGGTAVLTIDYGAYEINSDQADFNGAD